MGSCNTTQKEMGGKDLVVKICKTLSFATENASDELTFSSDHKAKVGDLFQPKTVGANTTLIANKFYYVKEVVSATIIKVSANKAGAAIVADATEATLSADVFSNIGGIRSKSFSISSAEIEITNEDSDEWKTLLDKAGVRDVAFSGSGIYSNYENVKSLRNSFLNNEMVCLLLLEVGTELVWSGCFRVSSLEIAGDYNAESSLSISASSSGPVSIVDMTA